MIAFSQMEDTMRSRAGFVSLAVVGLAFAGCGSAKKTATTAVPPPTQRRVTTPVPPHKSATYHAKLGPIRAGGAKRSGRAVISIFADSVELCWEFTQVKNVRAPTQAAIVGELPIGVISSPLSHGEGYEASGCREEPPRLLGLIEANPHKLYVVIFNGKHPEAGVRGRL
jgi:hypothetical protein